MVLLSFRAAALVVGLRLFSTCSLMSLFPMCLEEVQLLLQFVFVKLDSFLLLGPVAFIPDSNLLHHGFLV